MSLPPKRLLTDDEQALILATPKVGDLIIWNDGVEEERQKIYGGPPEIFLCLEVVISSLYIQYPTKQYLCMKCYSLLKKKTISFSPHYDIANLMFDIIRGG